MPKSFRLKNRKLIDRLQDKPSRDSYVERHVRLGVAYQLRALRNARGWTQKDVAKNSGVAQGDISKYESTEYGRMNISTLRKLASVYDVALLVRFVPFGALVETEQNIDAANLSPAPFENDSSLFEEAHDSLSDVKYIVKGWYAKAVQKNSREAWKVAGDLATLSDHLHSTRTEIIRTTQTGRMLQHA